MKYFLILFVIIIFFGCYGGGYSSRFSEDIESKKVLEDAHYIYFNKEDSLMLGAKIIYSDISGSFAYEFFIMNTGNKPIAMDYSTDKLYYQYQGEQHLCKQFMDPFSYPSHVNPKKYFWWTYLVDGKFNDTINDIEGLTYMREFIPYLLIKNPKAQWEKPTKKDIE